MTSENKEISQNEILKKLDSIREKDYTFSSGRILGSMCTQPHPIAKEAYIKFLETNLGDPELFPGLKEIESEFLETGVQLSLEANREKIGEFVEGVSTIAFPFSFTENEFKKNYRKKYEKNPLFAAALGYDMVMLVAEATNGKSMTGDKI